MQETWAADPSLTVEQALSSKVARIGEKLSIRRFEKVTGADLVVSYIHGDGKIGVLVEAATDVVNDDIKEALKNVAMQIAALHPQYECYNCSVRVYQKLKGGTRKEDNNRTAADFRGNV